MKFNRLFSMLIALSLLGLGSRVEGASGAVEAEPMVQTQVTTPNLALLGQIGGEARGIVVDGDLAYMGEGPRLDVLDLSNPASPELIGQSAPLPGTIQDLDIRDGLVYAAAGEAGLRIFDPSDPTQPVEVGAYEIPGITRGIEISGTVAYVLGGRALHTIDLNLPSLPVELDSFVTSEYAYSLDVSGSYAFIGGGLGGMQVIDVSNPSDISEVGWFSSSGTVGVEIEGNFAYIIDLAFGLRIVDVSNVYNMHEEGSLAVEGRYLNLKIADGIIFVIGSLDSGVLIMFDICNPIAPREIGRGYLPSNPFSISILGKKAYIVDTDTGLWLLDTSNPRHIKDIGHYRTPGPAYGVSALDDYAYTAAGGNGLVSLDIREPSAIVSVGWYDPGSGGQEIGRDIVLEGGIAYLAGRDGLFVVDVSTPTLPRERGLFTTNGPAVSISISEQVGYVGSRGSMEIIDIHDPDTPALLGCIIVPNVVEESFIVSDTAYIAAIGAGLRMIDVSNPADPRPVGSFYQPAFGVQVMDHLAYVVGAGLKVVDVTDPSQPHVVGSYRRQDENFDWDIDIALQDQVAFIAFQDGGVYILDVSNPVQPGLIGHAETPGSSTAVYLDGGRIYLASGGAGLYVFQLLDQEIYFPLALH